MGRRGVHRLVPAAAVSDDDAAAADDLARLRIEGDVPRSAPLAKKLPQPGKPAARELPVRGRVLEDVVPVRDLDLDDALPQLLVAKWFERADLDVAVRPFVRDETARLRDQADVLLDPVAPCLEFLAGTAELPVAGIPG